MTERQPPRDTPHAICDAVTDILVEQLELFEQLARLIANPLLNSGSSAPPTRPIVVPSRMTVHSCMSSFAPIGTTATFFPGNAMSQIARAIASTSHRSQETHSSNAAPDGSVK